MEAFFRPKTIVLIGASKKPEKIGFALWQKLRASGRKIYPVNPKFGYSGVAAVPGPIDLAVIAVPAVAVPAVVKDCAQKKVAAAIVISAGFAERGLAGVKLDPAPFPLLGPNCFGVANPKDNLDLTFAKTGPPAGNIGLISQSGSLASYLFNWAKEEKLGFSRFISLGNRLQLTETDFLDYLARDPDTKVIGLYLESFADGKKWLKTASRAGRIKPIVVLFGGRTESGRQAGLSHTASVSPPAAVADAAIAQTGCLKAATIDDFTALLEVFSLEPKLTDNDLAIITNAGGPAILAADTAGSLALDAAKPIDVLGDARAEDFNRAFTQVLKDKSRDAYLIIITPQSNTQILATCQVIARRFKRLKRPVVVSLLGGKLAEPARQFLRQNQIATIDLPEAGVTALSSLLQFYRRRPKLTYPSRRGYRLRPQTAVFPPGRFSWQAASALAKNYHLDLAKTAVAIKPVKPTDFSWPVVLKADPANIAHRTEAKAIVLNLNQPAAFRRAFRRLSLSFSPLLIQEQINAGHELFIGLRRFGSWPAFLTIGGGGLYTELYRDFSRLFLPVNRRVIAAALAQTRIGRIIAGYRTGEKLAWDACLDLILNLCRLFEEYSGLKELEVNPALVSRSEVSVVDLKIIA